MPNPVNTIAHSTQVTSPRGRTNLRDRIVSFVGAVCGGALTLYVTCRDFMLVLLDVTSDHAVPYLRTIPREDKPYWISLGVFLLIGLMLWARRKSSAPTAGPYVDPGFHTQQSSAFPTTQTYHPPAAGWNNSPHSGWQNYQPQQYPPPGGWNPPPPSHYHQPQQLPETPREPPGNGDSAFGP